MTGQVGNCQDWKLDNGDSGATLHVLDVGMDVAVSSQEADIIASLKSAPRGSQVQVPVTVNLSTFGGTAKIKYRAAGPARISQPAR